MGTVVLVYLELPLRAGPFRAALVYGTPNTWDGFRYIVLAEQFQGSLSDPFGELPRKFGELVGRTVSQFGILAPLIPVAFVVTAIRRPRYALLTGTAAAITCFFAASYVNADISRYYVGPALMAWTWLAILGAAVVDVIASVGSTEPATDDAGTEAADRNAARRAERRTRVSILAVVIAVALLVPTLVDIPARFRAADMSGQQDAARWADHVLDVMEPDAVILSWWSYSTPLWYAHRVEGKRPDIAIIDDRTRLDQNLGGLTETIDAIPRPAAGLRHPARPARGGPARPALRPRLHRRQRRELADPGHRPQAGGELTVAGQADRRGAARGARSTPATSRPATRARPSSSGPRPRRPRRAS